MNKGHEIAPPLSKDKTKSRAKIKYKNEVHQQIDRTGCQKNKGWQKARNPS